ncbi:MAG: hypothetical protein AAGA03_04055 [Planctomycetota bacterium]
MRPLEPGEKLEDRIASETEAGREALEVWRQVNRGMTGEQRLQKAFELTESTRQIMRAGLRARNPNASDEEIQAMYVDTLLGYHGTSLAEIRQKQADQQQQQQQQ